MAQAPSGRRRGAKTLPPRDEATDNALPARTVRASGHGPRVEKKTARVRAAPNGADEREARADALLDDRLRPFVVALADLLLADFLRERKQR